MTGAIREKCDVLIVGGGPGGLAAAAGARDAGADRVIVLERDSRPGGILNQCIHDGFGLVRYGVQLTGPEYAVRAVREARGSGAEIMTGNHVTGIAGSEDGKSHIVTSVSAGGLREIEAKAVVLSTGCRERTRGAIGIPGSRPAGVFTAGVIQNFINVRNIMPGRRVVILGSGDVGMIMARRLTLEGAEVKAVIEVLPEPAGLSRNVSQCLYDFGIPIYCSHTVSGIIGRKKLEAVEISELGDDMRPVRGTEEIIDCDCLVLSVGLIPENEVAETVGIRLDSMTNGAVTDEYLQTSEEGIFACGNSRRIMDLADFVSEQGETAGRNAAAYICGDPLIEWDEAKGTSMAKGFPEKGTVTCTLCPKGCQVRYDEETGEYTGNKCRRGADFAERERTDPRRILTSTVRVAGDKKRLLPVRSEGPVPKKDMRAIIEALSNITISSGAECGDLITDITVSGGENINIIASDDAEGLLLIE